MSLTTFLELVVIELLLVAMYFRGYQNGKIAAIRETLGNSRDE